MHKLVCKFNTGSHRTSMHGIHKINHATVYFDENAQVHSVKADVAMPTYSWQSF